MRLTDRALGVKLKNEPQILEHIIEQRQKLKELHQENLTLLEYKRLYSEARDTIAEKDRVIAKCKKRLELLVKCNLEASNENT